VLGVLDAHARPQHALLGEPSHEPRHPPSPLLVHPPHRAADRLLVELRDRAQGAVDVAVGGEHLAPRPEADAQVLAGVRLVLGVEEHLVAGAGRQLAGDRVEEARARAEDRVHGRPCHPGHAGDPVDGDPLGGRLGEAREDRLDDPRPGALGLLGAGPLLVGTRRHLRRLYLVGHVVR
jgi:hypothetical protein